MRVDARRSGYPSLPEAPPPILSSSRLPLLHCLISYATDRASPLGGIEQIWGCVKDREGGVCRGVGSAVNSLSKIQGSYVHFRFLIYVSRFKFLYRNCQIRGQVRPISRF